jgi:hypothetical protein
MGGERVNVALCEASACVQGQEERKEEGRETKKGGRAGGRAGGRTHFPTVPCA